MSDTPQIPSTALDAEGGVGAVDPAGDRPATPAATVVVLRDTAAGPEALLLRRQRGGAFSGMWVFPGGKVEAADAERAGISIRGGFAPGLLAPDDEIALGRRAAIREAMEEAQLQLAPAGVEVYSYWLPPPEAPRRFSTWFFVAPAAAAATVVVDGAEVHEHRWLTPAAAVAERDNGTLPLAPPTWMTLWQIGRHRDVASVLAEARSRPPVRFETRLWNSGARAALVWAGDAAYEDGDLGRHGPRRRLWVSDELPWRVEVDQASVGTPPPGAEVGGTAPGSAGGPA
jgi:8-oxo-dGTP pyrophosphatase MutT (NUDIX family)